jgi:hypothetical protein
MADDRSNRGGRRGKRTKKPSGTEQGDSTKPVERAQELQEQRSESGKEIRPMEEKRENTASTGDTPPVTEKPVPTQRKISRYVASVDEATGCVVKIEKLDEKTGEPKALSQEECAAAYAYANYAAPYYAGYAASMYDPMSSPAMQVYLAYLKAISDYSKTLSTR